MSKKRIDPVAIKQAIKDGQLKVFEKRGCIYIQDVPQLDDIPKELLPDGDCVCILELENYKTNGEIYKCG